MKKHVLLYLSLLVLNIAFGQLSGIKSIPGNFSTIQDAIFALNSQGVGPGGVIFNVAAGHTETFSNPQAGLISATGSEESPVFFQKAGTGPNPEITASSGTGSTDYIICFYGVDHITFDGITVRENPENTSQDSQAEWGFALLKSSGAKGSSHISIKNCEIELNPSNFLTCAIYSANHTILSGNSLNVSDLSGTNSWNRFSGLSISGCYNSFYLNGADNESPFSYYDQSNEIGVESPNLIDGLGGANGNVTSYGIYCSFQNGLKIANNQFSGISYNSTGSLYVISLVNGNNSAVDVYNNSISMTYMGTGSFYGIYNSGMGAAGTSNTANFHDNSIIGNTIPNFSASTLGYIYISTGAVNANLYNNIISGNIAGSGTASANGTIYYTYLNSNPSTPGNITIHQNTISGNQRIQAMTNPGPTYILYCSGSGHKLDMTENLVDSITIGSSGTTYALYNIYSGTIKDVGFNTVSNILNAKGSVYGIYNGNGTGTGYFHSNRVQNIVMNSISGKLYGIYQSSGNNQFHYNNIITELKAPQATANPAIFGMYLAGALKTGAYNNTIYLDAASSGASFGVTGIYASTSTETELKNNIVINNSIPGPMGRVIAYQRSSPGLSTYSQSSNNNNFSVINIPGITTYIYYDGTNADFSLHGFKTRVSPRDANSVSENTAFVNVSESPYNLNILTSIPSQCESGGSTIGFPVDITMDYEGNPIYPNPGYPVNQDEEIPVQAPDIGAYEFGGLVLDYTAPNISFIPLSNTSGTGDRVLTTTITDATGIPTVGTGLPVLYWRINNGPYNAATATWQEGNTYEFSFGEGADLGDIVHYYIVMQDMTAPQPNVGAYPYCGAGGYSTNPPACNPVPEAPYFYHIVEPMAGLYRVGNGLDYNTIGEAVADLAIREVTAPVVLELWDNNYGPYEAFPLIIKPYAGMEAGHTVKIKPRDGLNVTISGASSTGIIAVLGTDNIIIDGSGDGVGERSLTIENTSTQANSYVIGLFHDGVKGVKGCTIENCVLKAGDKYNNTWAIVLNPNGGDYDNILIRNNELLNAMTGIQFVGSPLGISNNGIITQNLFGNDNNNLTLGNTGLHVSNADGLQVTGNIFKNITTNANPKGINIGMNTCNTVISGNMITGIVFAGTTGGGGKGIDINTGTSSSNIKLFNNTLSQISGDGWSSPGSYSIVGIRIMGNTGGINLYFNSVNLEGNISRPGVLSDVSAAFYAASTVTGLDLRNNIFRNALNNLTGYSKAYSIYSDASASAFTMLDYNDYSAGGPEGILGYMGGNRTDIFSWQQSTSQDANSLDADPQFTSATDLHPTNPVMDNSGVYMPLILADIDGVQRTDPPDMGAYEFGINPELVTLIPSHISCGGAMLHGTFDANGLTVYTFFDYGPDETYGFSVAGTPDTISGNSPVTVSATISMPPLSTYHFRARGVTSAGVTVYSNDMTITTTAAGEPLATTLPATDIGQTGAVLHGIANAHCSPTTVMFEYGLTEAYGNMVAADQGPLAGDTSVLVSASLSGLEVHTLYHFRCVSQNEAGIIYGDDQVFTTDCPIPVPQISGPASACVNTSCYYVTEQGMMSYEWTVSQGGEIISGQGTNVLNVIWNTTGEQTVTVTFANPYGCPAEEPALMNVSVGAMPSPGISGSNLVCTGPSLSVYTTEPGFTEYSWTVSEGGAIVSGQGTYQVEIMWSGSGEQLLTVNYENSYGCQAPQPAEFTVMVSYSPGNAGPVEGTDVLCAGTRQVSYYVDAIPYVEEYVWSIPQGATIVAGENTNHVLVDFSREAKSGNISVYGLNACGAGQGSPLFPVTVFPVPPTPEITMDENYTLHSSSEEGNQWYFNGEMIEGATGQDYQPEQTGMYHVIVTFNACPSDVSNYIEVLFTGLEDAAYPEVSIYPVPNKGSFTVSISGNTAGIFNLRILNAVGVSVYEHNGIEIQGKFSEVIDLAGIAEGLYTVMLQNGKQLIQRKIIIAR